MAGQAIHIRKVEKGTKVFVYGKLFDKSEKGYKDGAIYTLNTTSKSLAGESLKCIVDKAKKAISIKANPDFPIDDIKIVGTSSLTKLKGTYNNSGTFTRGFGDIIGEILKTIPNINGLTVDFSEDAVSKLKKAGKGQNLILNSFDYNYINGLFNTEKKTTNENSLHASIRYLNTKIPKLPKSAGKKGKQLSEAFKKQIFEEVLNNLDEAELSKLLFQIYNKYFSTLQNKIELFKKTDTHKLEYVIEQFDSHFTKYSDNEKKWQNLFEEHYRVINPNYKYVIREVDTIFDSLDIEAYSRPVDFIGVDIYNNVELVELKTPKAPVISSIKDRNNYCLVHNCTKACTQLEKYLISLETNKSNVEKLIKEKISLKYGVKVKDINVVISKPKAKLIMGMTKPLLDKPSRHSDFQLQRHSFKNIEIVTFDEIYSSLVEIKTELSKKLKRK